MKLTINRVTTLKIKKNKTIIKQKLLHSVNGNGNDGIYF